MTQDKKQQPEGREQAEPSLSQAGAPVPVQAEEQAPVEGPEGASPAEAARDAAPGSLEQGASPENGGSEEGQALAVEGDQGESGDAADSDEPFGQAPDDIADLAEVIARDERNATLPPRGTSSVETALEQRPPRLAKAKRGPRTEMLESRIPEVVIPTDALKTQGFQKVRVVEAAELEKLRAAARDAEADEETGADLPESTEGTAGDAGELPGEKASSADETAGQNEDSAEGEGKAAQGAGRDAGTVVREGEGAARKKRKKPVVTSFHIVIGIVLLALLCTLAASGAFIWDRWYRYDDAHDVQGEWKMANAERTLVITDKVIKIDDGVAYEYTLDTKEKTITYSFGNASTTAAYRFGDDRKSLVIDESGKTDWLIAMHLKEDPVLASREVPEGVSKLSKLSDDVSAEPKDTEEIREDENALTGGTWVDGYYDYKRPKIETAEEKAKAEEAAKKKAEREKNRANGTGDQDGDNGDDGSSDQEDGYDDGAAYVDEATGNRYYYDATQMLYYDQAGNYYYDMYGNNPYEPYVAGTY